MAGKDAERGSITPLILGFFVVALLVVAGSIAAGNAFLHQSALQDRCDAAALAVGATALQVGRDHGVRSDQFDPGKVDDAIAAFLQRHRGQESLSIHSRISADASSVEVSCAQNMPVALGFLFGRASLTHHASSTTSAPTRS